MDFVYYIFIVAFLLLFNISKIEAALLKHDSNKNKVDSTVEQHNLYAHTLLMEKGEILSRAPTKRYPDMEENQDKMKLYYQRMKNAPIEIRREEPEKEKPFLVRVK